MLVAELFRLSGCCTFGRFDEACVLIALLNMVALRKASVGRARATFKDGKQVARGRADIHKSRVEVSCYCTCCGRLLIRHASKQSRSRKKVTIYLTGTNPNEY